MGQSSTKSAVVAWGAWEHGQLGVGLQHYQTTGERHLSPRPIEGLPGAGGSGENSGGSRRFSTGVHQPSNTAAAANADLAGGFGGVRQVACGGHHSAAVSDNGALRTWGLGTDGQLGHQAWRSAHLPKVVKALQAKVVTQVSCGDSHTACVTDGGMLFTWGCGQNGRLGHGSFESLPFPQLVNFFSENGIAVASVSCGAYHTAACTASQAAYSWGLGLQGRLGHGDESDQNLPVPISYFSTDVCSRAVVGDVVATAVDTTAASASGEEEGGGVGGRHHVKIPNVKIDEENEKGSLETSQFFLPNRTGSEKHSAVAMSPPSWVGRAFMKPKASQTVPDLSSTTNGTAARHAEQPADAPANNIPHIINQRVASRVICGGHHTAAITSDGTLHTWGGGAFGKLGHGTRLNQLTPKPVDSFLMRGQKCTDVSLGAQTSACVTKEGELYTWGQGGLLGHSGVPGAEGDALLPRQVAQLAGHTAVQVSCGSHHMCAVTSPGDVWSWGSSRPLSHGDSQKPSNLPICLASLAGKGIRQVACAQSHTVCLMGPSLLASSLSLVQPHSPSGSMRHPLLSQAATASYERRSGQMAVGGSSTPRRSTKAGTAGEALSFCASSPPTSAVSHGVSTERKSSKQWKKWQPPHRGAMPSTKSPKSAMSSARQQVASALGLKQQVAWSGSAVGEAECGDTAVKGVTPSLATSKSFVCSFCGKESETAVENSEVQRCYREATQGCVDRSAAASTDASQTLQNYSRTFSCTSSCEGFCWHERNRRCCTTKTSEAGSWNYDSLTAPQSSVVASLSEELRAYQEENHLLWHTLEDTRATVAKLQEQLRAQENVVVQSEPPVGVQCGNRGPPGAEFEPSPLPNDFTALADGGGSKVTFTLPQAMDDD